MRSARLYAVLFKSGVVKIGLSQSVRARWRQLRYEYGGMTAFVASPNLGETIFRAEQWALRRADRCMLRHRVGREFFIGSFGSACTLIRQAHARFSANGEVWRAHAGEFPSTDSKVVAMRLSKRRADDIAAVELAPNESGGLAFITAGSVTVTPQSDELVELVHLGKQGPVTIVVDAAKLERWALRIMREEAFA